MIDPHDPRRVLGFAGAPNFRDLGGYATAQGGHVATGRVYRSSKLTRLSADDRARLHALGVDTVIDLRGKDERDGEPSEWPAPPRDLYESGKASVRPHLFKVLREARDIDEARAGFIAFYGQLPSLYGEEYRAMFLRLAARGVGPTVIHCSAGKDRTGVGCALLLWALGVARETIVADYALTATLLPIPPAHEGLDQMPVGTGAQKEGGFIGLPAGARATLWDAHPEYLAAALGTVERDHGGVERYLAEALELSAAEIAGLRANLVV